MQQATGFTSDGQVMVDGLNKFISENTYSEKIFSIAGRRSGRTTRIVDSIIQELFNGKTITIADHHMDGKDENANSMLIKKVFARLASEHNIGTNGVILESKKEFVQIKFK